MTTTVAAAVAEGGDAGDAGGGEAEGAGRPPMRRSGASLTRSVVASKINSAGATSGGYPASLAAWAARGWLEKGR